MNSAQIQAMQRKIGVSADGFWGPKSIAACQAHLRGLMPKPHPFPRQGEAAQTAFYGPHGVPGGDSPPTKEIRLPFPVRYYDPKRGTQIFTAISAHVKCADSLSRVFQRLAVAFPTTESRDQAGILDFAGVYNPRPMRNGTRWSLHAWAAAIDLDAGRNGNLTKWPERARMPLEVMECFAAEGWLPAGAFWLRDAMHFQATQ